VHCAVGRCVRCLHLAGSGPSCRTGQFGDAHDRCHDNPGASCDDDDCSTYPIRVCVYPHLPSVRHRRDRAQTETPRPDSIGVQATRHDPADLCKYGHAHRTFGSGSLSRPRDLAPLSPQPRHGRRDRSGLRGQPHRSQNCWTHAHERGPTDSHLRVARGG
jgi:hypothetical protein